MWRVKQMQGGLVTEWIRYNRIVGILVNGVTELT
jgi:hypothetical protein